MINLIHYSFYQKDRLRLDGHVGKPIYLFIYLFIYLQI